MEVRAVVVAMVVLGVLLGAWPARGQSTGDEPAAGAENDGSPVEAAAEEEPSAVFEIYGFAMTDTGYNFGATDPDWFDVVRPTKLPSFENEFGRDGQVFFGARQSRLGVKSELATPMGRLKTIFEFEMYGVGADEGQTTLRLRHAWGELGQFGAGQYWSGFMDIDVFPNSIEYWGPNGMVFFRNVQVRWTPWQSGDSRFVLTAERPGASADTDDYQDRIDLDNIVARFPVPDFTSHVRLAGGWGHVQLAGIVRYIKWDDVGGDVVDLSGSEIGYGLNLTSNLKFGPHVARLAVTGGKAIQNYMNDGSPDIGVEPRPANVTSPFEGVALPMIAGVAFLDLKWNWLLTSAIGYSIVAIDNSTGQAATAFRRGQYGLVNILFHPHENVILGPEFQWGQRKNHSDGWVYDDFRVQFSLKYLFSKKFSSNSQAARRP
jgi:hypothetical protein